MTAIVIKEFHGISPAINPLLLPNDAATIAINTNLKDGKLKSFRESVPVMTPTKTGVKKTIYRAGLALTSETQYWLTWTTDVDVVKAPIDNDTSERTIYTGDGPPKQTDATLALGGSGTNYPNAAYRLGLPAPSASGVFGTVTGTPDNPDDPSNSFAYVLTYVNSWGEESAPSGPIGPFTVKPGQVVELVGLPGPPSGAYNVIGKRLYRSNTGNVGTAYQYLTQLNAGASAYNDSTPSTQLGELIETWGWEQLPDNATGLVMMANNIGAAFFENTVYLSVPGALYAWPPEFRLSTDSAVVALCPFGQSLFVGTRANPYIITGVEPSSMSMVRLDSNQACVSKRSVVSMMGGVVYASPDGIFFAGHGGLTPLTDQTVTRDQWQAINPASIHAYEHDGRYIAFYDTGSRQGAYVLDFPTKKLYELDLYCSAAYVDPVKDTLYLSIPPSNTIFKFDAGAPLNKVWRSKLFRSPSYVNFGYARVEAASYPVTFRLLTESSAVFTHTVLDGHPFRLPRMSLLTFMVEVEGTPDVMLVAVSEVGAEIESL